MPKRNRRRRRWILVLLVLALMAWCLHRAPLVLGTFNIRTFPGPKTDLWAVAEAIAELDADAFAVQEIMKPEVFQRVLSRASTLTGRSYRAALVPSCRGRKNGRLHVGVVYDADRLTLEATRPLGAGNTCPKGQPPGMVALLRGSGRAVALASVHFQWGDEDDHFTERRAQWAWLLAELPVISAELGARVIVAGDVNSTGFLEESSEERRFIEEQLARRELQLPTRVLSCSRYGKPKKSTQYEASLLDHILAPKDMAFGTPEVLGMCAALACAPQTTPPPGFETVSDHCPVRVALHE